MVNYLPDRVFPPLSVDFCLIPTIMVVDHRNKIFSPISLDLCLNMTILVNLFIFGKLHYTFNSPVGVAIAKPRQI